MPQLLVSQLEGIVVQVGEDHSQEDISVHGDLEATLLQPSLALPGLEEAQHYGGEGRVPEGVVAAPALPSTQHCCA